MSKQTLPIDSYLPEIVQAIQQNGSVILMAEPGAGKTTRVPVAALAAQANTKWIVLQPRRWAARLTATRVAEENGWKLGEEVGYQVRFENKTSSRTKLIFMTEGILLRRLIESPDLEGISGVVLDEFHERSLDLDLSLALLKEIQGSLRSDLKILVMSATLDPKPLQNFLPEAKYFSIPGRTYPVKKQYLPDGTVLDAVLQAKDTDGDILVFLPGSYEIERAVREIDEKFRSLGERRFEVLPLYAALSDEKQKAVFKNSGKQKIICSTNIAETSLTLPGVKVVIDSGWSKVMRMDPRLGLNTLETLRISRASAEQRAGRAGRVSEGLAIRLWSVGDQAALRHFETPEIHRVNLSRALLMLSEFGVTDFEKFDWFESPKSSMLGFAIRELGALGFLEKGRRTKKGEQAIQLPLEPKIAAIVLASREHQVPEFGARFAAFLENLSKQESVHDGERFFSRLQNLTALEQKAASQIFGAGEIPRLQKDAWDRYEAVLIESGRSTIMIDGKMVGRRNVVSKSAPLPRAALLLSVLDKNEIQASSWVPLKIEKLQAYAEKKRLVFWDDSLQKMRAQEGQFFEDLAIGALTEVAVTKSEAEAELRRRVLADPEGVFAKFNENFSEWILRVKFFNQTRKSDENKIQFQWEDWMETILPGKSKLEELASLSLIPILEGLLPSDLLSRFEREVPARIEVPSGSHLKIDYTSDPPKLSVRLQEVFGWMETPRIGGGRVPVLIELLSPGYKGIQLTRDLKSFWSGAYFEVKKELKARYPKHAWPDDPLTAAAVAKGRSTRTKS